MSVGELCFTVSFENVENPQPTKHFGLIPGAVVKVGRAKGNDLVVEQKGMSSLHVELRVKQEANDALSLVVRDVSTNGTALKRDGDANVIALEKNIDTTLPDGGVLLVPLRLKDVANGDRVALRVQYEESTSAPAQVANGTSAPEVDAAPPPAAPGQRCERDPYGDAPDEADLVTELDAYLDAPKSHPEPRSGSAAERLLARMEVTTPPPRPGFARKAGGLPPAVHEGAKRVPKSLPAPAIGSRASPPPPRKTDFPAPPKATSKARPKAVLPSPPERMTGKNGGGLPEEPPRGVSPEKSRRRRREERRRRSESDPRASPPRQESSARRRPLSRSRSPRMPAPPPPPSRDRRNSERSPAAGGRRDPLPWESDPPPSTWDGPSSGGRKADSSSWQSGGRSWADHKSSDREAHGRRNWEASDRYQQDERERSTSRGARRRRR